MQTTTQLPGILPRTFPTQQKHYSGTDKLTGIYECLQFFEPCVDTTNGVYNFNT
jgi:hypothetical protein